MEEQRDREICPSDLDAAMVETWLQDKAAEGWALTEFSRGFGEFVREEPVACRYRLTPLWRKETEPEEGRRELCEACAWQYVATLPRRFHVWRCDDPSAPEMETDPVAESYGYRYLRRRSVWSLIFWCAMAPLLVICTAPFLGDRFWLLHMAERDAPGVLTIYLASAVMTVVMAALDVRTLKRITRTLRTGVPRPRPTPYRLRQWMMRLILIVWVPAYLYAAFFSRFLDEPRDLRHRDSGALQARYVDIAELNPAVTEPEFFTLEAKTLELIPRMYQTRQFDAGRSGPVENYAETQYYRLLNRRLAAELEEELIGWQETYVTVEGENAWRTCPAEGLDGFHWRQDDSGDQSAVVRRGRSVAHVTYRGPVDLRQEPSVLAALLAE